MWEDTGSGIIISISVIGRFAFLIKKIVRAEVLTQTSASGSPHHPSGQKSMHFLLSKGIPNLPLLHLLTHYLLVYPKRGEGHVVTQVNVELSLNQSALLQF